MNSLGLDRWETKEYSESPFAYYISPECDVENSIKNFHQILKNTTSML